MVVRSLQRGVYIGTALRGSDKEAVVSRGCGAPRKAVQGCQPQHAGKPFSADDKIWCFLLIESTPFEPGSEYQVHIIMKKLLLLGCALLVTACATNYRPTYMVYEIEVVNNSREMIQQVTVTVPDTGRTFRCGNIAPLGLCSNSMGKRRYEYNPIKIDWVFCNTPGQTEEFVMDVPSYFSTGVPLRAVLAFSPEGELSAYFEQECPLSTANGVASFSVGASISVWPATPVHRGPA